MSLCDTCPKPGSCCKSFTLNDGSHSPGFTADNWMERGKEYAKRHHLPFIPLETYESRMRDGSTDPSFVGIRWMCPNLTEEGRCSDYENRPRLCRDYEAGSDRLCALYAEPSSEPDIAKELAA